MAVSRSRVYDLMDTGRLPHVKLGGCAEVGRGEHGGGGGAVGSSRRGWPRRPTLCRVLAAVSVQIGADCDAERQAVLVRQHLCRVRDELRECDQGRVPKPTARPYEDAYHEVAGPSTAVSSKVECPVMVRSPCRPGAISIWVSLPATDVLLPSAASRTPSCRILFRPDSKRRRGLRPIAASRRHWRAATVLGRAMMVRRVLAANDPRFDRGRSSCEETTHVRTRRATP